jgi:hypothetical protein
MRRGLQEWELTGLDRSDGGFCKKIDEAQVNEAFPSEVEGGRSVECLARVLQTGYSANENATVIFVLTTIGLPFRRKG